MANSDSRHDRRSFLATLSAVGGWLAVPAWTKGGSSTLRVEAASTLFYAHPDGASNLVRFTITGVAAPAGRLRVYDRSRRLLGTAGILRRGDALYGELWLPIGAQLRVVSELEAPGVRGPFRTEHSLTPHRKWTIHLFSMVDPHQVGEELSRLPPLKRAVQTALYRSYGVQANPIPRHLDWSAKDHLSFLRTPADGVVRAQELAIPVGSTGAVQPGEPLSATEILALAGSGVRVVTVPDASESFQWLAGPDGSRILAVSMPGGTTPRVLGFHDGTEIMAAEVERWLTTSPRFLSPEFARNVAVVTSEDTGQAAAAVHRAVSDWNSRFAFPAIIPGDAEALLDGVERQGGPISVFVPQPDTATSSTPTTGIDYAAEVRSAEDSERTRNLIATLAAAIRPGADDLATVAAEVGALIPGTVVFNPSPFSRSEFLSLADGSERLVTDVPGLGYAYFPDAGAAEPSEWIETDPTNGLEGRDLRARIGRRSGAIESLTNKATGKEWVRPGWTGLNSIEGARVQRMDLQRLPETATRLTVDLWSPEHGRVRSIMTAYDRLPWIDVFNQTEATDNAPIVYSYPFSVDGPLISWEVPAGHEESAAPVEHIDHLRWIRIAGPRNAILLSGRETTSVTVARDGRVNCNTPQGTSYFRIGLHSERDAADLPWEFGWGTTPMVSARVVPGDGGQLPTFGAVLDVDRVGVAALGVVPARNGDGVILYVQELLGVERNVRIAAGLLRFSWAQPVDLLERPIGSPLTLEGDQVALPVRGHGVAAVRLAGLDLNLK